MLNVLTGNVSWYATQRFYHLIESESESESRREEEAGEGG